MSSSDLAISVRGVGKRYTIRHRDADAPTTLAEAITRRLRRPFSRPRAAAAREDFWALRDVSFDVKRGEVLGIIGRNGAGKSTLLKILSRITEMTAGEVDLYGRVGSLLEVGTGFHQELTGRENIFLNGAILGMTRGEIRQQFDAIVDFAGVEKFLDTPVKRYSSGMYVRLAFAVAAHLRSEILLVDEVLAVGDTEFQKKCLGKMREVTANGRTVLFVSHNLQSVSLLCDAAACLHRGGLDFFGDAHEAISRYRQAFATTRAGPTDPDRRPGSGEYRFLSAAPAAPVCRGDDEKVIEFTIGRRGGLVGQMFVQAFVVDPGGVPIVQCDSRLIGRWLHDADAIAGRFRLRTPWLRPGEYRVDLYIASGGIVDAFEDACRLQVSPVVPYPQTAPGDALDRCVVYGDFDFTLDTSDRDGAGMPDPAATPAGGDTAPHAIGRRKAY